MKIVPLLLLSLLLVAGCATQPSISEWSEAVAGPLPDSNAVVTEYISTHFKDPYSVRDVKIIDTQRLVSHNPPLLGGGKFVGYVVIFSCNAKNSFGAYVGQTEHRAYVQRGRIVDR